MKRNNDRLILSVAMLGWVGVGAYGVWEIVKEDPDENWHTPYTLLMISLVLAVAFTTAATWGCSHATRRRGIRNAGLGLGVMAMASSLAAWAVPLWATLLAASCAVFAVVAPRDRRGGVTVLAAAQIVGMAVMLAAIQAEVGRRDSYGDYPAAFGIGKATIAAGSLLGLVTLARVAGSTWREPMRSVDAESRLTV